MKEENRQKIMEIKRIISNNLTNEEKAFLIAKLFDVKETKLISQQLLNERTDMYAVAIDSVLVQILDDLRKNNVAQSEQLFKHLEYLLNNFTSKPKRYHITIDEMWHVNDHQPIMRCVIDLEQPRELTPSDEVNYILKILKEFGY